MEKTYLKAGAVLQCCAAKHVPGWCGHCAAAGSKCTLHGEEYRTSLGYRVSAAREYCDDVAATVGLLGVRGKRYAAAALRLRTIESRNEYELAYLEAGYRLPDGWSWANVDEQRERWEHPEWMVPLGSSHGVAAWGSYGRGIVEAVRNA